MRFIELYFLSFCFWTFFWNSPHISINLWIFCFIAFLINLSNIGTIWFLWTSWHTWIFFEKSWRLFWNVSFVSWIHWLCRWTWFFFYFLFWNSRINFLFWSHNSFHFLLWCFFLLIQIDFTWLNDGIKRRNDLFTRINSMWLRIKILCRWFNLGLFRHSWSMRIALRRLARLTISELYHWLFDGWRSWNIISRRRTDVLCICWRSWSNLRLRTGKTGS